MGIEAYSSNVMGIPIVKIAPYGVVVAGGVTGFYLQRKDVLPPDLSVGFLLFDLGINVGSFIYWYLDKLLYEMEK